MTAGKAKRPGSADATAREWFVRLLDDDISQDEFAAWETWVREPEHGAAYDRVVSAWRAGGMVDIEPVGARALAADRHDPRHATLDQWRGRKQRRMVMAGALAAAAVVLLALGVELQLGRVARPAAAHEFATARAERLTARLNDGSVIRLGGLTRVDVAYAPHQRSLDLKQGEALFQVAHDRSRPFVVKTPFGAITAVGTAFNINVRSRNAVLVVTEGVVAVEPSALKTGAGARTAPLNVAAGQELLLDTSAARLSPSETGRADPPWLEGRLEYRALPLRLVLEDVNRYTAHPIRIGDPAVSALSYTGSVRLDDVDAWVDGLADAFPVVIRDQSDGSRVVVSSSKNTK